MPAVSKESSPPNLLNPEFPTPAPISGGDVSESVQPWDLEHKGQLDQHQGVVGKSITGNG